MTETIAELREWLKASIDPDDARDMGLRATSKLLTALPALLDRVEAGERVIDFLDMGRPIKGVEYRSAEEVFAIMADRIRLAEAGHYRLPPAIKPADATP